MYKLGHRRVCSLIRHNDAKGREEEEEEEKEKEEEEVMVVWARRRETEIHWAIRG